MERKTRSKKPSGTIGPITMGPDGVEFQRIAWPESKAEIESRVVELLLASARPDNLALCGMTDAASPVQNAEGDFDFVFRTANGHAYLELMEVAPLETVGRSHDMAPGGYVTGDMADAVWRGVLRKSAGYGAVAKVAIHLLLYATDWRFDLSDTVLKLLRHFARSHAHAFRSIAYFVPDNDKSGRIEAIYPCDDCEIVGFNVSEARARVVLNGNPQAMSIEGGGSASMPLAAPGMTPAIGSSPEHEASDRTLGRKGVNATISSVQFEMPLAEYLAKAKGSVR